VERALLDDWSLPKCAAGIGSNAMLLPITGLFTTALIDASLPPEVVEMMREGFRGHVARANQ